MALNCSPIKVDNSQYINIRIFGGKEEKMTKKNELAACISSFAASSSCAIALAYPPPQLAPAPVPARYAFQGSAREHQRPR
jgi:hypothetical protein